MIERQVGKQHGTGKKSFLTEPVRPLLGDQLDHVGVGQPGQRVELDVPAGVGDRLERHRPDRGVRDAELDDVAQLVLVQPAFDGGDQGDGEPGLGAVVQRLLLALAEVLAADLPVGALVEAVELQVDVDRLAAAGRCVPRARRRSACRWPAGCRWC